MTGKRTQGWEEMSGHRLGLMLAAILLGIMVLASIDSAAQEQGGAGLVVSGKATFQDVGLPAYPGARPHKEKSSDSDSARLGLWGGGYGFKLVVMSMESDDAPTQVADFYKKALSKYGEVLDCTNAPPAKGASDGSSKTLSCDDDTPEKGGTLFKAGTARKQHIVAVEPNGKGTVFHLIYVWARGE